MDTERHHTEVNPPGTPDSQRPGHQHRVERHERQNAWMITRVWAILLGICAVWLLTLLLTGLTVGTWADWVEWAIPIGIAIIVTIVKYATSGAPTPQE